MTGYARRVEVSHVPWFTHIGMNRRGCRSSVPGYNRFTRIKGAGASLRPRVDPMEREYETKRNLDLSTSRAPRLARIPTLHHPRVLILMLNKKSKVRLRAGRIRFGPNPPQKLVYI